MLIEKRLLCAALRSLENTLSVVYADETDSTEKETSLEYARAAYNIRVTLEHGGLPDTLILKGTRILLPGETA